MRKSESGWAFICRCVRMPLIAKIRVRDKQGVYASSKREFSHERVIFQPSSKFGAC